MQCVANKQNKKNNSRAVFIVFLSASCCLNHARGGCSLHFTHTQKKQAVCLELTSASLSLPVIWLRVCGTRRPLNDNKNHYEWPCKQRLHHVSSFPSSFPFCFILDRLNGDNHTRTLTPCTLLARSGISSLSESSPVTVFSRLQWLSISLYLCVCEPRPVLRGNTNWRR